MPAAAEPLLPPNIPMMLPSARPSNPWLFSRDLLGLDDVELHDPLGRLQLADLHGFAGLVHIAQIVGKRDFLQQIAQIAAFQHGEVRLRELQLPEIRDIVGQEPLRERRVVALHLAGNHDQRRPLHALVDVFDLLVGRRVGRRIRLLRGRRAGGGRWIPESRLCLNPVASRHQYQYRRRGASKLPMPCRFHIVLLMSDYCLRPAVASCTPAF